MLEKLLHWLRGYLGIQIRGTSPERFINLCRHKKLHIWNLTKKDDIYQFNITLNNYWNIKPVVNKTGLVPKIIKRTGLPFLLHRYRKRKGFFIGLFLCIISVYIMSLFIWDINILGGMKYTPEAMLKFLKEKDVYAGIMKSRVDCQEIEETIRLAYNDIGWVSAEIKGTRLIIKITETDMPAPMGEARAPSHMVATKDAIIKSIITRTGTPAVRPGDIVKKGDILVSGIVTVKDDFDVVLDLKPVIASATIRCKSYYDYYDAFLMDYKAKEFTGEMKNGYYITIFGKKIFLYNRRNPYVRYDIIVNENTLHITDSFYLPLRYGMITVREYEELEKTYTEEEAESIAKTRLKRYFDRLSSNGVYITENNVTIRFKDNKCIVEGRILVEEPAWEYRVINESEWRIEQTDEYN